MLSEDRNTPHREADLVSDPVAADEEIFAGGLVALNGSGYLVAGNEATGLTYRGRADEYVDNTGGADGDTHCLVRRKVAFKFNNSGTDPVDQSHVGQSGYIVDDETVAATDGAGTRSPAGTILAVEGNGVWVE